MIAYNIPSLPAYTPRTFAIGTMLYHSDGTEYGRIIWLGRTKRTRQFSMLVVHPNGTKHFVYQWELGQHYQNLGTCAPEVDPAPAHAFRAGDLVINRLSRVVWHVLRVDGDVLTIQTRLHDAARGNARYFEPYTIDTSGGVFTPVVPLFVKGRDE